MFNSKKVQKENRQLVVSELLKDGTAMVSLYDVRDIVDTLLIKGVEFKVEKLKNGIFMITVLRLPVETLVA